MFSHDRIHEHTYSRQKTQDKENRIPSFLHCHNYVCPSTPKSKTSKKIGRSTPTGATPYAKEKKRPPDPLGTTYRKWSDEEQNFILDEFRSVVIHSNAFWRCCARKLNDKFSTSRTGESCRLQAKRLHERQSFPDLDDTSASSWTSDDLGGISFLAQTNTLDASCQTDISIPFEQQQSATDVNVRTPNIGANAESSRISSAAKTLFVELVNIYATETPDVNTTDIVIKLLNASNSIENLSFAIFNDGKLKTCLWKRYLCEIGESARSLCEMRKSYLFHNDYQAMKDFKWSGLIEELADISPELCQVLLAVTTPKRKMKNEKHLEMLVKNIGLVYSILMKARWKKLSRVQRIVSMTLFNEQAPQKIYDRLQPLGVCVSYSVSTTVLDTICGQFRTELIDSVKCGKKFRLVGDNVNFTVDVSRLRQTNKKHMEHWFGSAAIVQTLSFNHLSPVSPQENLLSLSWDTFLPTTKDWNQVEKDYCILIMRVLVKHMPAFKALSSSLPKYLSTPTSDEMKVQNKIIPLPVMSKNEQKYSEVIDVLDAYEELVQDVHEMAGISVTNDVQIHIGGDQLTRERFSGAKRLRSIGPPSPNRFQHLSPITFEFFHLQMALLSVFYKQLYNEKSTDTGTLGAERIRLGRHRADGSNVKNHFEDCKELAVSLVDMYILEGACHFFGMDEPDGIPSRTIPNFEKMTANEKINWIYDNVGEMVNKLVWPFAKAAVHQLTSVAPTHYKVTIIMPNGQTQQLLIPAKESQKISHSITDDCTLYAHSVLELGLLFKDLTDAMRCPDRLRMISILKLIMLVCKGNSTRSKYALEILRFLCHQFATLSERVAHESFYGCFVNSGGKFDTHIAADMAMEHLVRNVKSHIQSMASNKAEKTIKKRTGALVGLSKIAQNFDSEGNLLIRAHRHKSPSVDKDERMLFENIHRLKPFSNQHGRTLTSQLRLSSSLICRLTRHQLQSWIGEHQVRLKNEIGK